MKRSVLITGLGPVSALGLGRDPTWARLQQGASRLAPVRRFDASGFDCTFASELDDDFAIRDFVPKTYRKGTKVMSRDVELAVAAADLAFRDAGLVTSGLLEKGDDTPVTYPPNRVGAQIGAGLIPADLDEITDALAHARDEQGQFDYARWGREGMSQLTPLWLLKYLPNMLACHVTIIHDIQGPSNTITCTEASAALSLGEQLHTIQANRADAGVCGGIESKLNPLTFLRQIFTGRMNTTDREPATLVRPFDQTAAGAAPAEGGAVVILEAEDTWRQRTADRPASDASQANALPYARVLGFGAAQSNHRDRRNLAPDPLGRGLASAIEAALRDADLAPDAIDLITPNAIGEPAYDASELASLRTVFGDRLDRIPMAMSKAYLGLCGAGAAGLDLCIAADALSRQALPPIINCDQPRDDAPPTAATRPAIDSQPMTHALVTAVGLGGQCAAVVLGRFQP